MRSILLPIALVASAPAAAQVAVTMTTEADATRTMAHVITVPAPPADVWRAIATVEGWKTWAVPAAWAVADDPASFETSYSPDGGPGAASNIVNRFVVRLPERIAVFHTVRTPDGFPYAAAYKRVISVFEIAPAAGGTRVRLTGTGYGADAAGDALIGFFHEGNRASLEALRTRFVRGPIDWKAKRAPR